MAGFCGVCGRFRRVKTLSVVAFASISVGASISRAELPSDKLPPGTVAFVSNVPDGSGTITQSELRRAVAQAAAQAGMSRPPRSADPVYMQMAKEALGELLDAADIEGEAAARNVVLTQSEISTRLASIKKKTFKSEAEYRNYIRQVKFTDKEIREIVKLQMLVERIEARVIQGIASRAAQRRALQAFVNSYGRRWRSRTVCAPQFAIDRCSNGPSKELGSVQSKSFVFRPSE
jgi:hypothetical protein